MSDRRTPPEKRKGAFREKLSLFMVIVAAAGAFLVLLDPKYSVDFVGFNLESDGEGFSADLKGAVISAILIGGWTAVKEYWLGASATGQNLAESQSRIAEAIPAAVAHPVPVKTETMNVEARTVNATEVAQNGGTVK